MGTRRNKRAIILENLISISITDVCKHIPMQTMGTRSKAFQATHKDPATGERGITHSFKITANIDRGLQGRDFLEIEYQAGPKNHRNLVPLMAHKINPTKSGIFYWMICPVTGRRCRKVYFTGNNFVSRLALDNAYYRAEVESKKTRRSLQLSRNVVKSHQILKESEKKYFMRMRAGKLTANGKRVEKAKQNCGAAIRTFR